MKNLIFGIFLVLFCVSYKAQNVQIYNATTTLSCDGGAVLIDSLQFDNWIWLADDSTTVIQQNGSSLFGLCLGTYVLQLTSGGSSFYFTFTITGNTVDCSSLQVSVNIIIPPTNQNSYDGYLASNVTGGAFPYTYTWYNGMTTQDANGVGVGEYELCVTDANGCMVCDTGYVNVDSTACTNLNVTPSNMIYSTPGLCDGSFYLLPSGGTAPYYISSNEIQIDAYGLVDSVCESIYYFYIGDANGCSTTLTVDLTDYCAGFGVTVNNVVQPSSPSSMDGSIDISAYGGVAPYTFIWSNGMNTEDISNLQEGTYYYYVYDNSGQCDIYDSIVLTVSTNNCSGFSANIQLGQNATSTTINDAYVQVGFTGGTGPYTIYQLNDTIISADTTTYYVYNLGYGNFCYQVEDANDCITSACQYIGYGYDCSTFSVSIQSTDASTFVSGCNGTSTLQFQNGNAPYYINNYQIPGNSYTYTNLCPGIASFNVVDVNGCSLSITDSIGWIGDSTEAPPFINVNTYTGNVSAEGSCDGSVYLQIIGGLYPYTIYDNNGIQVDQQQTGLCEGVYTNIVVDASGQTFTVNYFIASPFNIIDNTIFPDSLVLDTLINNVLQNCAIDFSTLDTAFISNIEFISMDSVVVTWAVLDGNGTIEFIENYSLGAGFGVYELIFQVFCPQRATDKYLIVREQFKVGGSFLGMEEQASNFNVYPNPVADILNIQLETDSPTIVSISDVTGKLVYQNDHHSSLIQINTSELAKGQYFVNIHNEKLTTTKIILK